MEIKKYKFIIVLIVSIFILYLLADKGEELLGNKYFTISLNLVSAITASALVGIYIDLTDKGQYKKELEDVLKINTQVVNAGIKEYHHSWETVDIKPYLQDSKLVDIYLHYGSTLFGEHEPAVENFLSKKGNKLRIFLSDYNNKSLEAASVVWEISDNNYNLTNIKSKLTGTINLLKSLAARMRTSKRLKGQIEVYRVTTHSVPFSFYKFDKKMIVAFNKISHHKTPKPPVLVIEKMNNTQNLYNKICEDYNVIFEEPKFLIKESI
jgi:hypothetical protein